MNYRILIVLYVYFVKILISIEHGEMLPSKSNKIGQKNINILFSRDRDELEKFIKLLITDSIVRKKFSGKTSLI